MDQAHRVFRLVALTLTIFCLAGILACRASGHAPVAADSDADKKGRIVRAPASLMNFRPADRTVTVDAARVNLRQVFEDLGPDATLWYQHVQTLANPFFEGRLPGTRGAELTAEYIEYYFRTYGLEPAFPGDEEQLGGEVDSTLVSYVQPFDFSVRGPVTRLEVTRAELSVDGEPLVDEEDFVVLGNSGSGELTAPLSFVGYGIESGPDGYSSFDEDTSLSGRIALLLRYEPLDDSGRSRWSASRFSPQSVIARKMKSVADRGAEGILLVNPPGAVEGQRGLETIRQSRRFGPQLDIPVLQVTPEVADRIIREADPQGRDLTEWRGLADRGEVETVHLSTSLKLTAATGVEREQSEHAVRGRNVGGILHGKGDLAEEWIAIGAHHDHVGDGSLGGINPRNLGQLHPGADDNASGTAGVLVLARMLSEAYDEAPQDTDLRSVIFLTFDGEEMGLRGSRHFADHPSIPPESISILLNMDMIGRLRSRNLSVLGMATTGGLEESLRPIFEESGLTIAVNRSGSGRSDDASFHRMNVPALHFFTGMHREYTSPRDQAYTVNPAGAGEILDLLYTVALTIAARPEKLVYREPPPSRGRDRAYAPVRLGIRPGMGDDIASGVLVDQVYEGTSAGEAGMKGGDVIIGWDDEVLESVRDLFERLQEHKPGDRVQLTVLRDGEHVVLEVTFQASRPE